MKLISETFNLLGMGKTLIYKYAMPLMVIGLLYGGLSFIEMPFDILGDFIANADGYIGAPLGYLGNTVDNYIIEPFVWARDKGISAYDNGSLLYEGYGNNLGSGAGLSRIPT